jgi:XTP/dITP diphosphohydrolase
LPLYSVTGNQHKFEEMQAVLKEFDVELKREKMDFVEFSNQSLEQIALSKAKQAFEKFRVPLIVEDTALYFEAYKNFPGTEPKSAFNSLGFEGLLRLLRGKKRGAYFKTVICYIESDSLHRFFEAEWHGKIATKVTKPKARGMPYDKIFIPEGMKKAAIELPLEEKNRVCQRGIAARKLGKWLKEKALGDLIDSI